MWMASCAGGSTGPRRSKVAALWISSISSGTGGGAFLDATATHGGAFFTTGVDVLLDAAESRSCRNLLRGLLDRDNL